MIGTEDFWALIEASATATGALDGRLAWLTDRLGGRPVTAWRDDKGPGAGVWETARP
ncbi:hypothetical protein [Micromonospora deserti]|uniref:hypothetical protein n=1 Tax=Micromonospora deserti TaxID=2070366 RepID=UPI0013144BB3|nr:hypothetical protein [Micromonospora deserti]